MMISFHCVPFVNEKKNPEKEEMFFKEKKTIKYDDPLVVCGWLILFLLLWEVKVSQEFLQPLQCSTFVSNGSGRCFVSILTTRRG